MTTSKGDTILVTGNAHEFESLDVVCTLVNETPSPAVALDGAPSVSFMDSNDLDSAMRRVLHMLQSGSDPCVVVSVGSSNFCTNALLNRAESDVLCASLPLVLSPQQKRHVSSKKVLKDPTKTRKAVPVSISLPDIKERNALSLNFDEWNSDQLPSSLSRSPRGSWISHPLSRVRTEESNQLDTRNAVVMGAAACFSKILCSDSSKWASFVSFVENGAGCWFDLLYQLPCPLSLPYSVRRYATREISLLHHASFHRLHSWRDYVDLSMKASQNHKLRVHVGQMCIQFVSLPLEALPEIEANPALGKARIAAFLSPFSYHPFVKVWGASPELECSTPDPTDLVFEAQLSSLEGDSQQTLDAHCPIGVWSPQKIAVYRLSRFCQLPDLILISAPTSPVVMRQCAPSLLSSSPFSLSSGISKLTPIRAAKPHSMDGRVTKRHPHLSANDEASHSTHRDEKRRRAAKHRTSLLEHRDTVSVARQALRHLLDPNNTSASVQSGNNSIQSRQAGNDDTNELSMRPSNQNSETEPHGTQRETNARVAPLPTFHRTFVPTLPAFYEAKNFFWQREGVMANELKCRTIMELEERQARRVVEAIILNSFKSRKEKKSGTPEIGSLILEARRQSSSRRFLD